MFFGDQDVESAHLQIKGYKDNLTGMDHTQPELSPIFKNIEYMHSDEWRHHECRLGTLPYLVCSICRYTV